MKRQRLLTNRNFNTTFPSAEFIEKDERGFFYWRARETMLIGDELMNVECCFPVDEGFVIEKFEEMGRVYRPQIGPQSPQDDRGCV